MNPFDETQAVVKALKTIPHSHIDCDCPIDPKLLETVEQVVATRAADIKEYMASAMDASDELINATLNKLTGKQWLKHKFSNIDLEKAMKRV